MYKKRFRAAFFLFTVFITNMAFAGSPFTKVTTVGTAGRDGSIMFAIGPDFYFGGGENNKDFWVYHSDSNTTRKLADIPGVSANRSFATAFAIGGKGYIGLGDDQNGEIKNDLWQFDPVSGKWARKADFPGPARNGAFVFIVGNVAYIGGGSDNVYLDDDFYAYNALTDQWTQKQILPTGFTIFTAAFTINNTGYITTGQSGNIETASLYQYDTTDDSWTQKADFPGGPRQTCVAMVVGNKAYVGLGQTNYDHALSDFYGYDPVADQWEKVNTFTGGPRGWACAASNGTKAYFAFGWDLGSNFYNDLWKFDPSLATDIAPTKQSTDLVHIYPDPARNYLYVSVADKMTINSLVISDINGKIVKTIHEGMEAGSPLKIDLAGFEKGMYFFSVTTDQGIVNHKFVIY